MEYYTILTDAGRALEAAALAGEKSFTLSMCALGDGTGTPDPAATQLRHEVWRGPLSSLSRDADNPARLVMEAHVPPKDGGFIIREFGIYTDEGVLFAIGNQPESYKPTPAEGSGIELTIRTICTVSSAVSVTLQIDPSIVMASQKYVDEKIDSHTHGIDQISGLRAELDEVIRLSEATTFYVRQNGSDENDGRAPETAVRSFERIYEILRAVDSRGHNVTVDIGPGVWGNFTVPGATNIYKLFIRGAGPDLTTINGEGGHGITHAISGCEITFQGMAFTNCSHCLDVRRQATAFIGRDLNFGTVTDYHLMASYGSMIGHISSDNPPKWKVSGGAKAHVLARHGSAVYLSDSTIILEGTPDFSLGFVYSESGSTMEWRRGIFEGSTTGRRYYTTTNGVIHTGGSGATYFPGDQAGVAGSGGLYL